MTKVFGEKLDWEHVAIIAIVLAIVYFIWKHNGIKGAYHALLSDIHKVDEKENPGVKSLKKKHAFDSCKDTTGVTCAACTDSFKGTYYCNEAGNDFGGLFKTDIKVGGCLEDGHCNSNRHCEGFEENFFSADVVGNCEETY